MAIKHLIEYYNNVCDDRSEAIKEIEEFEEECRNGLVAPERVEQLKDTMKPLMDNYEQISYFMFLLNMPVKEDKHSRYYKAQKKLLEQIKPENTTAAKLDANKSVINELKNF